MKLFAILLGILVTSLPITLFAEDIKLVDDTELIEMEILESNISEEISIQPLKAGFLSIAGKVSDIYELESPQGNYKRITIESEEGGITNFIVTNDTYFLNDIEPIKEDSLVIYYDRTAPAPMIYPPQYNAILVASKEDNEGIYFDYFDGDLISSDGDFKINVGNETEIIDQKGNSVENYPLRNLNLVLYYTVVLESYPAQVVPEKIVILDYKNPIAYSNSLDNSDNLENFDIDIENSSLVVDDVIIDNPKPYLKDDTIMVPLRMVVETLGQHLIWEGDIQTIYIGSAISLTISNNSYTHGDMSPIVLDVAPEIKDNLTYVPLNFFTEVMELNNAYFFEGQVVINDNEKME